MSQRENDKQDIIQRVGIETNIYASVYICLKFVINVMGCKMKCWDSHAINVEIRISRSRFQQLSDEMVLKMSTMRSWHDRWWRSQPNGIRSTSSARGATNRLRCYMAGRPHRTMNVGIATAMIHRTALPHRTMHTDIYKALACWTMNTDTTTALPHRIMNTAVAMALQSMDRDGTVEQHNKQ